MLPNLRSTWLFVGLALLMNACGPNSPRPRTPAPLAGPIEISYQYGIGADDVLQIDVWKHPELSREALVRPDGFISLPLVRDILAAGTTPTDLGRIIQEQLRKFIEDPDVTITVKDARSYKVYVIGKVAAPGMFVAKSPLTALQALTLAGGPTPFASTGDIIILRKQDGKDLRLPLNFDKVVRGVHPEQNILLRPGDTVVVP